MRYRPEQVVALLDSERAGETQDGLPDRRHASRRRSRSSPTTALVGVATTGGRFPPAWRELLEGVHRERPRRRERPARVHLATTPSSAVLAARHGVELRDLRKPPPGLNTPTGENLDARRQGRAHGRLGLRDREDDGRARARRRGAAPRDRERVRPDRPDRDRDRRVGDLRRRGRRRLHRRRRRAARARGRRARRRAPLGRGAGLAARTRRTRASRSGCCTAARRTRSCSAISPGSRSSTTTSASRCRRSPSSSSCTSGARCIARRAKVVAIALNTRDLDDDGRQGRDRGRRGRDRPPGGRPGTLRRRTGSPSPSLTGSGSVRQTTPYRGSGALHAQARRSPFAAPLPLVVLRARPPPTLIVGDQRRREVRDTVPTFFMPTMQADGLKMNALTIRWDDTQPTTIDPDLQSVHRPGRSRPRRPRA